MQTTTTKFLRHALHVGNPKKHTFDLNLYIRYFYYITNFMYNARIFGNTLVRIKLKIILKINYEKRIGAYKAPKRFKVWIEYPVNLCKLELENLEVV